VVKVIVAVTGMPGSGKSLVARVLAEALGAEYYSMGDAVRREVERRGLPLTVENVEYVATMLRREHGRAAVAKLLLPDIENAGTEYVVVDGLRSVDEAGVLASAGRVCIVAVHASPKVRLERLMRRGRVDDIRGARDLALRDRKNLEYGIGEAIALADFMIVNEGSIEEARRQALIVARRIADGKGKSCCGGRLEAYGGPGEG